MRCDIAIGAIRGNSRAPILVTEEMVEKMKTGAVIVDVSIDRGGCFETSEVTTHKNPTIEKFIWVIPKNSTNHPNFAQVRIPAPEKRINDYPHQMSGGMRQRVALAASLASNPQILIGDEPTTALAVTTQREMLNLLERIQQERNMSLLLITHDLGVVAETADRIAVTMTAGQVTAEGTNLDLLINAGATRVLGILDANFELVILHFAAPAHQFIYPWPPI